MSAAFYGGHAGFTRHGRRERPDMVDEGAQLGQDLLAVGEIQEHARRRRCVFGQHFFEPAQGQVFPRDRLRHLGQDHAVERQVQHGRNVIDDQRARHRQFDRPVAVLQPPTRQSAVGPAQPDTGMGGEIGRYPRPPASRKVGGTSNHDDANGRREPDRNHVGGDELAHPDAGVEPVPGEVHQLRAGGNLHHDLGIGRAERGQQRPQHARHDAARHGQPQQTRRLGAEITRRVAGGDDLLKCGTRPLQKTLTGFGQPYAARRPREQGNAQAHFQRPYRLAHRRRRHAEIGRSSAEAAALGDADEGLDPIERTALNCIALLHGSYRLSRFIKQSQGRTVQAIH